jgi:hypothetical protein
MKPKLNKSFEVKASNLTTQILNYHNSLCLLGPTQWEFKMCEIPDIHLLVSMQSKSKVLFVFSNHMVKISV